jgi:hypothetical protein
MKRDEKYRWDEMRDDLYVTILYQQKLTHNKRLLTRRDRMRLIKMLDLVFVEECGPECTRRD